MTDIAEVTSAPAAEPGSTRKRKGTGLDGMVLSELKQVAQTLGLKGTGAMRKGQLIDAIRSAQGGGAQGGGAQGGGAQRPAQATERGDAHPQPETRPGTRNGAEHGENGHDANGAANIPVAAGNGGGAQQRIDSDRTDSGHHERPAQQGAAGRERASRAVPSAAMTTGAERPGPNDRAERPPPSDREPAAAQFRW